MRRWSEGLPRFTRAGGFTDADTVQSGTIGAAPAESRLVSWGRGTEAGAGISIGAGCVCAPVCERRSWPVRAPPPARAPPRTRDDRAHAGHDWPVGDIRGTRAGFAHCLGEAGL